MDSMQMARTIVAALTDAGVRDVVIGPGSRSAPLVYALSEAANAQTMRLHVRVDERAAAFTALGLALGSKGPAAVLTTSGTAAGNLMPAMMEASHTDTQLIAITADRPAELQGTGANQTTDQRQLFGVHARTTVTIEADYSDPVAVRATVMGTLAIADGTTSEPAGPVHLNVRFREPLVPAPEDIRPQEAATGAMPVISTYPDYQWDPRWQQAGSSLPETLKLQVSGLEERHTVVVAGHGAGPIATEFAMALGLPLFAEPSSNARYGPNAVAAYPLLLANDPEDSHPLVEHISRVILFGRPTLSRQLSALLKRAAESEDMISVIYAPKPVGWFLPGRRPERPISDLGELAKIAGQSAPGWLGAWQAASTKAQTAVEGVLTGQGGELPNVMRASQLVATTIRGNLVLGSSSVIRDADMTWRPPTTPHATVFAHRGLAGIDGTISTATGIALATEMRTTALVGDLTFLYDSLVLGTMETEPDLDIVLINDAGGAIFAGLEHGKVAQQPGMADVVERFFGTPQDVDFASLCAAYGIEHIKVTSEYELISSLGDPERGRRVIEVVADRAKRPELRQKLREAVRSTFV